jgi:hypothetical protein
VSKSKLRPVIVCTEFRGVFFGYTEDVNADPMVLKEARMAIYWGTTRGVMELAEVGPNSKSKISAKADIPRLPKITSVFDVTPAAEAAWKAVR